MSSRPIELQTWPHHHRLNLRGASLADRQSKRLERPRFNDVRLPDPICPVASDSCECMQRPLLPKPPGLPPESAPVAGSPVGDSASTVYGRAGQTGQIRDSRLRQSGRPESKVPRHRQNEDAYDNPSLVCPSCVTGSHFVVCWLVEIVTATRRSS